MATLSQLQTWLSEAEAARHALMMGETAVEISRDGRRVTYERRDARVLDEYINRLNREISAATAAASGRPRRRALTVDWC